MFPGCEDGHCLTVLYRSLPAALLGPRHRSPPGNTLSTTLSGVLTNILNWKLDIEENYIVSRYLQNVPALLYW